MFFQTILLSKLLRIVLKKQKAPWRNPKSAIHHCLRITVSAVAEVNFVYVFTYYTLVYSNSRSRDKSLETRSLHYHSYSNINIECLLSNCYWQRTTDVFIRNGIHQSLKMSLGIDILYIIKVIQTYKSIALCD